ncbi:coiled-coil domain-containing protein 97 isoform X2 [Chamaea fasciata]|uniref:coiled-coil domain-containing protein 97 isoform X2 n=1 Tax=Chamaea fasciata TaxID=190680 RepID=UPI00336A7386
MAEPPQTPRGDPPKSPESPPKSPNPPNSPQTRRRGRPAARTRLRNRRYAALRELIRGGEYFSQEQMRLRAPGLFHHYIGRFQDPKTPQIHPKNPEILLGDPKTPQGGPKIPQIHPKISGEPQNLRELLLRALEDTTAQDDEEDDEEEEEDDDDDDDEGRVPDAAERELLRLEFTTRMYQRFLEGQDGDFDYSQVDENPDLDNLDIVARDLEDRYFDEEEPSQAPLLE